MDRLGLATPRINDLGGCALRPVRDRRGGRYWIRTSDLADVNRAL